MDIERLIIQMSKNSNYKVKKPSGQPSIPIVALSFTQFLQNLLDYKGDYFFWKDINHSDLGDAYKVRI